MVSIEGSTTPAKFIRWCVGGIWIWRRHHISSDICWWFGSQCPESENLTKISKNMTKIWPFLSKNLTKIWPNLEQNRTIPGFFFKKLKEKICKGSVGWKFWIFSIPFFNKTNWNRFFKWRFLMPVLRNMFYGAKRRNFDTFWFDNCWNRGERVVEIWPCT